MPENKAEGEAGAPGTSGEPRRGPRVPLPRSANAGGADARTREGMNGDRPSAGAGGTG